PIAHEVPATVNPEKLAPRPTLAFGIAGRSERLQRIGENLCDIDRLAKAIEEYRLRKQSLHTPVDVTPGSTLETALANIWRKVLGRPQIGMNDNFFEAGGTTPEEGQIVCRMKKKMEQKPAKTPLV